MLSVCVASGLAPCPHLPKDSYPTVNEVQVRFPKPPPLFLDVKLKHCNFHRYVKLSTTGF